MRRQYKDRQFSSGSRHLYHYGREPESRPFKSTPLALLRETFAVNDHRTEVPEVMGNDSAGGPLLQVAC